jgi:hypothetical protein
MNWLVVPSFRLRSAGSRRGPPYRPFTLLDGIILIAGIALGFAGFRPLSSAIEFSTPDEWVRIGHIYTGFFLILSSLLVLCLRLVRPRPSIRRISRQPGAVACFSMIAFGIFFQVDNVVQTSRLEGHGAARFVDVSWWLLNAVDSQAVYWFVVPIIWIVFIFGRIGRPEASWIDRSGRVLGWCWIVWGLAGWFL